MQIIEQTNLNELDSMEINKLEREWRHSLPRFSDKELLKIFPEAKVYLKQRLKELKKEIKTLTSEIEKNLKDIYKNIEDEFAIWFYEEVVKTWKGEKLNQMDNEIKKLQWLLNPDGKKSNRITESMIQKAKEYPFENLIESKRKFALCPFHNEKNPSFYIKNNWGYCFSCGWHGDVIKFLMERDELNFQEAIKHLI